MLINNSLKKKCEDLEDKSRSNQIELEKVTGEINEYRKQVTHLEMELESLRGTNEYLERNLADIEKVKNSKIFEVRSVNIPLNFRDTNPRLQIIRRELIASKLNLINR